MTLLKQTEQDGDVLARVITLDIPAYRDAYSDRTAWLMACFSELAYLKYDQKPLTDQKTRERFLAAIDEVVEDKNKISLLNKTVEEFFTDHQEQMGILGGDLGLLSYKLDTVFDRNGTQAILVRDDAQKRLVLAFRGTEPKVMKDIKTDLDAALESFGDSKKAHRGFTKAYLQVGPMIKERISDGFLDEYRLYITGHSLGGALASVAAKHLMDHKGGISACYTFGSPRVGNKDWVADIKAPMYRIVNASDAVPMLPPGATGMNILAFFAGGVPIVGSGLKNWVLLFTGYFHSGDMRYLGKSKTNDFSDTKLLPNTNSLVRIWLWIKSRTPFAGAQDHSVSIYRRKLGAIAISRNERDN